MAWTVETLNETVDAELEALPADMRARFVHISRHRRVPNREINLALTRAKEIRR